MPVSAKYFFQLVSDRGLIPDAEEISLWTAEGFCVHLVRIVQTVDEVLKGSLTSDGRQGWHLEVTDDAGRRVMSISLTDFDENRSFLPLH
jgi:hypothetical protein